MPQPFHVDQPAIVPSKLFNNTFGKNVVIMLDSVRLSSRYMPKNFFSSFCPFRLERDSDFGPLFLKILPGFSLHEGTIKGSHNIGNSAVNTHNTIARCIAWLVFNLNMDRPIRILLDCRCRGWRLPLKMLPLKLPQQHGQNDALSFSGQRQRRIRFSVCNYPCIIVNAFWRKDPRTLTLSLQFGHARDDLADGANRQIGKESKQLMTLLVVQVMELNRVVRFKLGRHTKNVITPIRKSLICFLQQGLDGIACQKFATHIFSNHVEE